MTKLLGLGALLCLVLSTLAQSPGKHVASLNSSLRQRSLSNPDRELKAATKAVHLSKRHASFFTTTQLELVYAESKSMSRPASYLH